MKPATHSGHCQACGSLQKLPAGVLSLHGYNVSHGYFSGTCVGARSLPFELSCDLVKMFIESAQRQLESVEATQARLRTLPTRPRAWMHVSPPRPTNHRYAQRQPAAWEEVDLDSTFAPYSDGKGGSLTYTFTDSHQRVHGDSIAARVHGMQRYERTGASDQELLLVTCLNYNEVYARWLQHEVDSLQRYIAWQQERVRTWKPAALLPVTHKDKLGFVPTPAAY